METPFYHDDAPAAPSFSQVAEYERYPGGKMLMSKKAASMGGGHHFLGGGSAAAGRSGNHGNLGLPGSSALMAPGSSSAAADMNLLKLASPDLEHLIIQSNQGLVSTSPASSAANPFLYRSQATNEQEGFADGFVKALADLHKQNQLVGGGHVSPSASYQRNLMSGGDMPVYTNLSSYTPGQMPYAGGQMGYGGGPQTHGRGPDAPQIDLETQERIKAERKKLRNRIAASKCRKRKLERISRLEEKVKVLKSQNSDLASTAAMLRQQVAQLKQKVMSHVTNGCQIAVATGAAAKSGTGSEDSSC
uniref:JunE proto-oncogene, AP-1 transcription factor subunit n=1 Tax=Poecilia formosa TaxID=48698 RepID=A0A087XEC8_POEFO